METCRIYLAGAMSGLSVDEQTKWRKQIRDAILYGGYDYEYKPLFFDSTQYYNFEEPLKHKSELEAMNFNLNMLRKSDLVIVNFNKAESIGTAMELAVAYENRTPVVGMNGDGLKMHPWLECCCDRICNDMSELVSHIVEFYLN